MPRIPTYSPVAVPRGRISTGTGGLRIPSAPPALTANAESFYGGDIALTGNLAKTSEAMADMAGKFWMADRITELNTRKTNTLAKMTEFETGLEGRQDWQAWEGEFTGFVDGLRKDYEENVKDPAVLQALNNDLNRVQAEKGVKVRAAARKKQIEYGRAQYESQIGNLANLYGQASDEERQDLRNRFSSITMSNLSVGYIKPEEAQDHFKTFANRTERIRAQQDLRRDPESFDPDKYPLLKPEDKITLGDHAIRMTEVRIKARTLAAEKEEKAREKAVKERADLVARSMWVRLKKGLTLNEVESALISRDIALDEGKALQRALTDDGVKDDPLVRLKLKAAIREGKAGKDQIEMAVKNRWLSGPTASGLLDDYYERQKEDDPAKKPEYRDAETYIGQMLKTTGMLDKYDEEELPRIEYALDEFRRRVKDNEPIQYVRDEIVGRFRPTPVGSGALPRPLFGTKEDLAAAFRKTRDKFAEGAINFETYKREILNLQRLDRISGRQPVKQESGKTLEDVNKKLKERPH